MTSTKQSDGSGPDPQTVGIAIDYAWHWFELHAGQRMRAMEFFLVAVAFLTAGFGTALRLETPGTAATIALAGVLVSAGFYGMECRTRELIHIGEAALRSLEEGLAIATDNPLLQLVREGDNPRHPTLTYHYIFRVLYLSAAFGFLLGAIYVCTQ
jgi:hypothetical protein